MLYNRTLYALAVNVDRVTPLPVVVGVFLFWLVIFFGLVLSVKTSDTRLKWNSLISKRFIFEVPSQPLKRREAENYGDNNQSICAARWTLDHVTKNHIATSYNISYPFCLCWSITHGRKLSEFIHSDVPSNTLLLIPNEFGTVFQLAVQRLETLE